MASRFFCCLMTTWRHFASTHSAVNRLRRSTMLTSAWVEQIFYSIASGTGGIVRRSISDVQRYASVEELIWAVKARGFHMIQTDDQFVIFCNDGGIKLIC